MGIIASAAGITIGTFFGIIMSFILLGVLDKLPVLKKKLLGEDPSNYTALAFSIMLICILFFSTYFAYIGFMI